MNKTATIAVRLPPELLDELRSAALDDSRSISSAIQAAIKAWLAARNDGR